MKYGSADSFNFDFELNGILFGSKIERKTATTIILHSYQKKNCHHDHIPFISKGKLPPRSYSIHIERKQKSIPVTVVMKRSESTSIKFLLARYHPTITYMAHVGWIYLIIGFL